MSAYNQVYETEVMFLLLLTESYIVGKACTDHIGRQVSLKDLKLCLCDMKRSIFALHLNLFLRQPSKSRPDHLKLGGFYCQQVLSQKSHSDSLTMLKSETKFLQHIKTRQKKV